MPWFSKQTAIPGPMADDDSALDGRNRDGEGCWSQDPIPRQPFFRVTPARQLDLGATPASLPSARTAANQVPLSRRRSLPRAGLVTLTRSQDRDQRPTAQRLVGKDWTRPHGKACRTHTAGPLDRRHRTPATRVVVLCHHGAPSEEGITGRDAVTERTDRSSTLCSAPCPTPPHPPGSPRWAGRSALLARE